MPRRPQTTPARREPARRSRTRPTASSATTPETAVIPPAFSLQHLTLEQLGEIRRNTNWRLLFTTLGLQRDEHKSRPDDWWARSPFKPDERTASFHMTDSGWYCFSTSQGGGAVELVQHLYPSMNSFDVGRWLLERGISSISGETRSHVSHALVGSACPPPAPSPVAHELASLSGGEIQAEPAKESKENEPIRQDLRPSMDPHHPLFAGRGISVETLRELGAGFWQRKRPKKVDAPDPLNGRIVFQIRGLRNAPNGTLTSVILSHMGRAVTPEQEAQGGKWCFFHGFRKSQELYNIDLAVLDPEAREQALSTGHVIVAEGCFDAAKLFCAGIKNVVATFGSHLSREQIPRFELLASELNIRRFLVFYDRDQDGNAPHGLGAQNAVSLLQEYGFEASAFDWNHAFESRKRGAVRIPESITDPAEFSVEQVRWLRQMKLI